MKRRYWVAAIAIAAIGLWLGWLQIRAASESFQRDADIVRLKHLKYYGLLIEEYFRETGHYPLQGSSPRPVYVAVANRQQRAGIKGQSAEPHTEVAFAEFIRLLESGLGRPIDEFYDPQLAAVHRPNFYVYRVEGAAYSFTVHLDRKFSFAQRMADRHCQVAISNAPRQGSPARLPWQLWTDAGFNKVIQSPLEKPGFFEARERQYLHETKGAVLAGGAKN